jgi:hypothetical protein
MVGIEAKQASLVRVCHIANVVLCRGFQTSEGCYWTVWRKDEPLWIVGEEVRQQHRPQKALQIDMEEVRARWRRFARDPTAMRGSRQSPGCLSRNKYRESGHCVRPVCICIWPANECQIGFKLVWHWDSNLILR